MSQLESHLVTLFPDDPHTCNTLTAACRYSLSNGGKRIRPALVMLTGEMLGANEADLIKVACAMECLHTYSLVHDDLPAMDDDALRRGKPTCHIQFDEATAILVGDALQSKAFELLSQDDYVALSPHSQLALINHFAKAAGVMGMCGGQALDIAATGQFRSLEALSHMHTLKTGALLEASVTLGALCAPNVDEHTLKQLQVFAKDIGLAFQVQDDILDIEGDTSTLGKPQGSDEAANKATYPALLGLAGAKDKADALIKNALLALAQIDADTARLELVANYIIKRDH